MICIPIVARNTECALELIAEADIHADLLEVRLDLLDSWDLGRIIRSTTSPVLLTYRSKRQGGKGSSDPGRYVESVLAALEANPDFVDVEAWLPQKDLSRILDQRGSTKIIISNHILTGTPRQEELDAMLGDLASRQADVVKIVSHAMVPSDNLRVLNLIPRAQELCVPIIAFCMGSIGKPSRVLSVFLGAYLSFASLERGQESAEGQMPVLDMKELLRVLKP